MVRVGFREGGYVSDRTGQVDQDSQTDDDLRVGEVRERYLPRQLTRVTPASTTTTSLATMSNGQYVDGNTTTDAVGFE